VADLARELKWLVSFADEHGADRERLVPLAIELQNMVVRRDVQRTLPARVKAEARKLEDLPAGERIRRLMARFERSRATIYRCLADGETTTT
jgi:hypothetical protein